MRVGRNDPCPCGSGKKYKKCCLPKEEAAPRRAEVEEAPDLRQKALQALLGFASAPEHARTFEAAARIFNGGNEEELPDEDLAEDEQVKFVYYALFDHLLEDGRSLAEVFLQRGGVPVPVAQQRMIRRWTQARLRLHEVQEVRAEEGLQLVDLWTDEPVFVTERAGTRQLAKWDLLAARVAPEDDGTLRFEGGLYVLPPGMKQGLLGMLRDFEAHLRRTEPGQSEDRFFRRCAPLIHRAWIQAVAFRPMPTIVTAEGDPMVFGKVVFHVVDSLALREALDAHPELSPGEDEGEYTWIEEAEDGFTRSLGHVVVEEGRLVLEVTSRQRAERGRLLLEKAAGGAVRHRATRYEGVEKAMERSASKRRKPAPPEIPPEVAAPLIQQYKERHYATWPDQPLPALDGRTPRQAVRSRKLRPRLVDLLKEMENMESRAAQAGHPAYDFGRLWTELGLAPPT